MKPLDSRTMALTGRSLIEASAGTGKTYTIASLYLRYIVEQPLKCELTTDKILVVTFTRAATAELRDRIRQRLHLAVACFRGQDPAGDLVIQDLLERFEDQKPLVLKRLYAAEKSMDEAAIYTIHGFCHRAISANAFATAAAHAELNENEDELLLQVVEDFWRQLLYPLNDPDYSEVQQAFRKPQKRGALPATPQNLMKQLKGLLSLKALHTKPEPLDIPLRELVGQLKAMRAQAWSNFADAWKEQLSDCANELKSIPRARASSIEQHIQALADWLALDTYQTPPKKSLTYFNKQITEKAEVAALGLAKCQALSLAIEELSAQVDYRPALMAQALAWVKAKLAHEKLERQLLAPDDLMKVLFESLSNTDKGVSLASDLATQYPVALIDEFQDTDPLQFGIFQTIYQQATDYAWLMIGDPKQSIYAFRGGDIHTYGMAKRGTDERRWLSLEKNYRSSQNMVEAVNQLFGHYQQQAFYSELIGYERVASFDQGEKGTLTLGGQAQAAVQFWQFDDEARVGDTAAAQCAEQIVTLLNGAQQNQVQLGTSELTPGDLAILVRNRDEAQIVSTQLRARGVRSVFLSRDSVFGTEIALQLLRLVEAFYQPTNERLLVAALASGLLPYTAREIADQRDDEELWQTHLQRFDHYHQLWLRKGLLTAIHHWLADYQVAAGLMMDPIAGERQLADLLHTAELLQSEAMNMENPYALLRQFRRWVQYPDEQNRAQQLRLESDKDLVQIVTIHASKGLEYPVVFIPFGLGGRSAKEAVYPEQGKQIIEFSGSQTGLTKADTERLAEEIRLFYVAITRAVFACYIGLARLRPLEAQSALGHLLNLPLDGAGLNESIHQLVKSSPGVIASSFVSPGLTSIEQPETALETVYLARHFERKLELDWRLSSYSAMASQLGEHQQEYVELDDEFEASANAPDAPAEMAELLLAQKRDRFTFVKGPQAGNALHQILELQSFARSSQAEMAELVNQSLRAAAIEDVEHWQPAVTEWLIDVLNTPLVEAECSLEQLEPESVLAEMEFFIQVRHRLHANRFNLLLDEFPLLAQPVRPLEFDQFHGLLKGFVDLIFERNGRFYVCDYKSNHLGDGFEDYHNEALVKAMADHRYDAQLLIYTLALHRYLKQQLGSRYDYEDHIGGCYYLFLRGMSCENQGQTGVFYVKPERMLIEQLDALFMGNRELEHTWKS